MAASANRARLPILPEECLCSSANCCVLLPAGRAAAEKVPLVPLRSIFFDAACIHLAMAHLERNRFLGSYQIEQYMSSSPGMISLPFHFTKPGSPQIFFSRSFRNLQFRHIEPPRGTRMPAMSSSI